MVIVVKIIVFIGRTVLEHTQNYLSIGNDTA